MHTTCLSFEEARFLFQYRKEGKTMKVTVNGREEEAAAGATVGALIKARGLNGACIVVEYNQAILKQDEWETVVLKPHDMLEIVSFVGGG